MASTQELVDEGRKHFESRNYSQAERYFLQTLSKGAEYADVLNMLGVIYHAAGKFNDSIACFQQALAINPNYTEAVLNLAVLRNDLGDYKEAKELYKRIGGKKKKSKEMNSVLKGKISNMHMGLGDTYSGIGHYKEAIEEFKKALVLNPNYKDIRTKLGICYRENNQKDLSIKELAKAVKENPNYTPARIQLGLSYYSAKHVKKAEREWKEVLKRDKKNETVKIYLRLCEKSK
jgi:tetratricopeptide (TPR) repeat protein